jgi:hypothetical protein
MNSRFFIILLFLAGSLPFRAAWAQLVAPSHGGEVSLVLATSTTMELSFGNYGNGQGRIVAMAAAPDGEPVPLDATDDVSYTANATYGNGAPIGAGYVVYNGTGHSTTVMGLKPNTYYYITNAEYNTDNTKTAYNTRSSSMLTATRAAPITSAPLPVELVSFTGSVDTQSLATLHWATATELNSSSFAIERSANGAAFVEVGRVMAAGNSFRRLAYQWPDSQPLTALAYYRLKQIDQDGTAHYSAVLTLVPQPQVTKRIDVYPNPSAGQGTQLLLQGFASEKLTLRLADALGRLVMTQTIIPNTAQYNAPLSLPAKLAAGTYILTLASNGTPVQKRVTIAY